MHFEEPTLVQSGSIKSSNSAQGRSYAEVSADLVSSTLGSLALSFHHKKFKPTQIIFSLTSVWSPDNLV